MKKLISLFLILAALSCIFACGEVKPDGSDTAAVPEGSAANGDEKPEEIIDLTKMSAQIVYAYVYDMMTEPEKYIGKTFRIGGVYNTSYYDVTGCWYHWCVIADATACCSQGLEFILNDAKSKYPESGADIVIEGKFGTYDELGITYYYIDADTIKA